jgi:hypothetical protein
MRPSTHAPPRASHANTTPAPPPPPPSSLCCSLSPLHRCRYEGAGLYRRVHVTSASLAGSIATHGVAAPANVTGAVTPHTPGSSSGGLYAPAVVHPTAVLRNDGATASALTATFTLFDAAGRLAASATAPTVTVPVGGNATAVSPALVLQAAELWSVGRPYLYTLQTAVSAAAAADSGGAAALLDATNVTVGVRATVFDPNTGFHLNGEAVRMRGYCDVRVAVTGARARADRAVCTHVTRNPVHAPPPPPSFPRSPACARLLPSASLPTHTPSLPCSTRTLARSARRCPRAWTCCACSSCAGWAPTRGARRTTRPSRTCWA